MADEENEQSPYTRPGFIVAAVVVVGLVVAGIIVGVNIVTRDDAEPAPTSTSTPSAAPSSEPTADAGGESVCGLAGETLEGTVTAAPEAEWPYQGTTAYPVSSTFGPADSDAAGVRTCFQRSPEGALFMAANAIVQGSDPSTATAWAEYALAEGQYRDTLAAELGEGSGAQGRMTIEGFRILKYDGNTARIDLAVGTSSGAEPVTVSGVYELIWQDGDWKINTDAAQPLNIAAIPNTNGYTPWGE